MPSQAWSWHPIKMWFEEIRVFSIVRMMRLTERCRYFAFTDLITPWSIGCVWDVVFGGNRSNSTAFKPSTLGWAGQLSIIIAIFLPSFSISLSTSFIHSSNNKESIQLFFWTCNDTAVVLHVWSTLVFKFCQWQTLAVSPRGNLQQHVPLTLLYCASPLNTFSPSCALFSSANLGRIIQIRRHYITEVALGESRREWCFIPGRRHFWSNWIWFTGNIFKNYIISTFPFMQPATWCLEVLNFKKTSKILSLFL